MALVRNFVFAQFVLFIAVTDCSLTVRHRSQVAVVGSRISFACSTNTSAVNWSRKPLDASASTERIGNNGKIILSKTHRFQINEEASSGRYDLVIKVVEESDAGYYMCRDDGGFGDDFAGAELVVVGLTGVSCETISSGSMSATPSDVRRKSTEVVEGDALLVECKTDYAGNVVPEVAFSKWPEMEARISATERTTNARRGTVVMTTIIHLPVGDSGNHSICFDQCNCSLSQRHYVNNASSVTRAHIVGCRSTTEVSFPVRNVFIDTPSKNGLHIVGEVLDCRAEGSPPPVVSWIVSLVSADIDTESTHPTVVRGSRLTLRPGVQEITCVASNVVRGRVYNATSSVRIYVITLALTQPPAKPPAAQENDETSVDRQFIVVLVVSGTVAFICVVFAITLAVVCGIRGSRRRLVHDGDWSPDDWPSRDNDQLEGYQSQSRSRGSRPLDGNELRGARVQVTVPIPDPIGSSNMYCSIGQRDLCIPDYQKINTNRQPVVNSDYETPVILVR